MMKKVKNNVTILYACVCVCVYTNLCMYNFDMHAHTSVYINSCRVSEKISKDKSNTQKGKGEREGKGKREEREGREGCRKRFL